MKPTRKEMTMLNALNNILELSASDKLRSPYFSFDENELHFNCWEKEDNGFYCVVMNSSEVFEKSEERYIKLSKLVKFYSSNLCSLLESDYAKGIDIML